MNKSPRFTIKDSPKYIKFLNSLNMHALTIIPCNTLSLHDNMRKYAMALTPNNVLFLRYKTVKTDISILRDIPLMTIAEVKYEESNNCYSIKTTDDDTYTIQSPDFEIFFHEMNIFFTRLMYSFPKGREIKVSGFTPIKIQKITAQPPNISLLRYEATVAQYSSPLSLELGRNFFDFETTPRCFFNFEKYGNPVTHPNILSSPLIAEKTLSVLAFRGIAPKIVCKAIRTFLKYTKSLNTIILEDYEDIQFEQFDFETISKPNVVSWTFKNVFTSNKYVHRIPMFFKEFSYYPSEIQTFHIEGFVFDKNAVLSYLSLIKDTPTFSTIEFLIMRNLDLLNEEDILFIYSNIIASLNYLNCLFEFELSFHDDPIVYELSDGIFNFVDIDSLRSLKLTNVDLSLVETHIHLPQQLLNLEINNSKFSFKSISHIIESIPTVKHNMSLSLENMQMSENDWKQLYDFCEEGTPLTNIIELNWSGNKIPDHFVTSFCKIFLPLETIRVFQYNRALTYESISAFTEICDHLEEGNLWGLEIAGGQNKQLRLGSQLISFIKEASRLTTIEHLNISNHGLNEETIFKIINILKESFKMLRELSIDDTKINNRKQFYNVYKQLFSSFSLKSLQRPLIDMNRLFDPAELGKESFAKFKKDFLMTRVPSIRSVRTSFYYHSLDIFEKFQLFYLNYPCSIIIDYPDNYGWMTSLDPIAVVVRSVYSRTLKRPKQKFRFHQIECISSPFSDPKPYELTTTFKTPPLLGNYKKYVAENLENYDDEDISEIGPAYEIVGPTTVFTRFKGLLNAEFAILLNDIEAISQVMNKEAQDFETEEKKKYKYRKRRHSKRKSFDGSQSVTFSVSSFNDLNEAINRSMDEESMFDEQFRSNLKIHRPTEFVSKDAVSLFRTKCTDLLVEIGKAPDTSHALRNQNVTAKKDGDDDKNQEGDKNSNYGTDGNKKGIEDIFEKYLYQSKNGHPRISIKKRLRRGEIRRNKHSKISPVSSSPIRLLNENNTENDKDEDYDEYEEYENAEVIKNLKTYNMDKMINITTNNPRRFTKMQTETLEDLREFGQDLFNYSMNYDATNAAHVIPLPDDPNNLKKPIMPLPGYLQRVARRYVDLVPFENYQIADKDNIFNGFSYNTDKILGMETIVDEKDNKDNNANEEKKDKTRKHKHHHKHNHHKHNKKNNNKHKKNKDKEKSDESGENSQGETIKEKKKKTKKYEKYSNKDESSYRENTKKSSHSKKDRNNNKKDLSMISQDETYEDSMASLRDKFKFKYSDYDKVDAKYNSLNIINLAYITKNKRYNENNFVIIDDSEYDLEEPSDVEGSIKRNIDDDELNDELPAIPEILSKPSTKSRTPNRDLKFTINSQLMRTPLSRLKISYNTESDRFKASPITQSMLFIDKLDGDFKSSKLTASASTSSILKDLQAEKITKKKKDKKKNKKEGDKKSKKKNKKEGDKKSKRGKKNKENITDDEEKRKEEFKKIKVVEPKSPGVTSYLSLSSNLTIQNSPIRDSPILLGKQSTMPLKNIPPPLFTSSLGYHIGSRIPPPMNLKAETDDKNDTESMSELARWKSKNLQIRRQSDFSAELTSFNKRYPVIPPPLNDSLIIQNCDTDMNDLSVNGNDSSDDEKSDQKSISEYKSVSINNRYNSFDIASDERSRSTRMRSNEETVQRKNSDDHDLSSTIKSSDDSSDKRSSSSEYSDNSSNSDGYSNQSSSNSEYSETKNSHSESRTQNYTDDDDRSVRYSRRNTKRGRRNTRRVVKSSEDESTTRKSSDNEITTRKSSDNESNTRKSSDDEINVKKSSDDEKSSKKSSEDEKSNKKSSEDEKSSKKSSDDEKSSRKSSEDEINVKKSSEDEKSSKKSSEDEINVKKSSDDEKSGKKSSDDEKSSRKSSDDEESSKRISDNEINTKKSSDDEKINKKSRDEESNNRKSSDDENISSRRIVMQSNNTSDSEKGDAKNANQTSNRKSITESSDNEKDEIKTRNVEVSGKDSKSKLTSQQTSSKSPEDSTNQQAAENDTTASAGGDKSAKPKTKKSKKSKSKKLKNKASKDNQEQNTEAIDTENVNDDNDPKVTKRNKKSKKASAITPPPTTTTPPPTTAPETTASEPTPPIKNNESVTPSETPITTSDTKSTNDDNDSKQTKKSKKKSKRRGIAKSSSYNSPEELNLPSPSPSPAAIEAPSTQQSDKSEKESGEKKKNKKKFFFFPKSESLDVSKKSSKIDLDTNGNNDKEEDNNTPSSIIVPKQEQQPIATSQTDLKTSESETPKKKKKVKKGLFQKDQKVKTADAQKNKGNQEANNAQKNKGNQEANNAQVNNTTNDNKKENSNENQETKKDHANIETNNKNDTIEVKENKTATKTKDESDDEQESKKVQANTKTINKDGSECNLEKKKVRKNKKETTNNIKESDDDNQETKKVQVNSETINKKGSDDNTEKKRARKNKKETTNNIKESDDDNQETKKAQLNPATNNKSDENENEQETKKVKKNRTRTPNNANESDNENREINTTTDDTNDNKETSKVQTNTETKAENSSFDTANIQNKPKKKNKRKFLAKSDSSNNTQEDLTLKTLAPKPSPSPIIETTTTDTKATPQPSLTKPSNIQPSNQKDHEPKKVTIKTTEKDKPTKNNESVPSFSFTSSGNTINNNINDDHQHYPKKIIKRRRVSRHEDDRDTVERKEPISNENESTSTIIKGNDNNNEHQHDNKKVIKKRRISFRHEDDKSASESNTNDGEQKRRVKKRRISFRHEEEKQRNLELIKNANANNNNDDNKQEQENNNENQETKKISKETSLNQTKPGSKDKQKQEEEIQQINKNNKPNQTKSSINETNEEAKPSMIKNNSKQTTKSSNAATLDKDQANKRQATQSPTLNKVAPLSPNKKKPIFPISISFSSDDEIITDKLSINQIKNTKKTPPASPKSKNSTNKLSPTKNNIKSTPNNNNNNDDSYSSHTYYSYYYSYSNYYPDAYYEYYYSEMSNTDYYSDSRSETEASYSYDDAPKKKTTNKAKPKQQPVRKESNQPKSTNAASKTATTTTINNKNTNTKAASTNRPTNSNNNNISNTCKVNIPSTTVNKFSTKAPPARSDSNNNCKVAPTSRNESPRNNGSTRNEKTNEAIPKKKFLFGRKKKQNSIANNNVPEEEEDSSSHVIIV